MCVVGIVEAQMITLLRHLDAMCCINVMTVKCFEFFITEIMTSSPSSLLFTVLIFIATIAYSGSQGEVAHNS